MFTVMYLPADQGKDGNAEGQQAHDNPWDGQAEGRKAIQKKEQNQTPGGNRARHFHFHSPLGKQSRLREPVT